MSCRRWRPGAWIRSAAADAAVAAAARSGPRPTTERTRPPAVRTVPSASTRRPGSGRRARPSPRPRRDRRSGRPTWAHPGSPRRPARSRPTHRGGSGGASRACPDAPSAGPRSPRAAASRIGPSATASRGRIACVSGSPKRALHSSRTGPSVGEHQAGVERATERGAAAGQLGQDRRGGRPPAGPARPRRRAPGAGCRHPSRRCSGRGPRRAVACDRGPSAGRQRVLPSQMAMRLASRPTSRSSTTTQSRVRRPRLRRRARRELLDRPFRLRERVADRHALAGHQPVRLDHDAAARRPRGRRANAIASSASSERLGTRHRGRRPRPRSRGRTPCSTRSGQPPRSARRPRTRPRSRRRRHRRPAAPRARSRPVRPPRAGRPRRPRPGRADPRPARSGPAARARSRRSPAATMTSLTPGSAASFQASACSRPPLPTITMRVGITRLTPAAPPGCASAARPARSSGSAPDRPTRARSGRPRALRSPTGSAARSPAGRPASGCR